MNLSAKDNAVYNKYVQGKLSFKELMQYISSKSVKNNKESEVLNVA